MRNIETDLEVLEYAVQREQEAYNFFMTLATRVKDPGMRNMLESLAVEELEHRAKLELEFIKNGVTVDTGFKDSSADTSPYAVIDEVTQDLDCKDILEICIRKEELSFKMYADLLLRVREKNTKETLLTLMEEEIKHKFRFETEYEKLSQK